MRKLFTLLFALMASANMMFAESGTCGENLTWDLTDGVLTIAGSGAMTDFENNTYAPWNGYSSLIQSVVIRDSVTTVGNYAFAFCSNLSTISLGDSLISISEYAFFSCTLLGGATIPDKVITIGDYAFANCDRLSSVELGESVESIGDYVFNRCVNLSTVTLSERVKSIGKAAFMNCQKLSEVTNFVAEPQIIESDVFSAVDLSASTLYVPGNSVELYQDAVGWKEFGNIQAIKCTVASGTCGAQGDNLTWELSCDSVLTISGTGEMENYTVSSPRPWYYAKSIIIEDGVTSIGNYAFQWCSALTTVSIPLSVTRIGEWAFTYCDNLTSISIPESIISIEYGAFAASGLLEVTIPNSATNIGIAAFSSSYLTEIKVESDNPNYCALDGVLFDKDKTILIQCPGGRKGVYTIPKSITSIGKYAFSECSSITSVTIGENVQSIQDGAFEYCSALTTLEIPNSVTSIGGWAFQSCTGLTSITIPNSVISIGETAFRGCSNLASIYCEAIMPPTCGIEAFVNVNTSIPVYVPEESVEAYKKADGWKEFENIEAIEPLPETVTVAQALEIGQGLAVKETFETDLTIVGYVVGVETEFDSQKRNQTYWIADTQYGKATGALYVYRGACDKEVKRGYKVSIQGKITRYTDLVIETVEKAQVTILDETETDEPTILWGKCGAEGDSTNLSWQLNLSTWTLDIQGSGPMADSLQYLPWHSQNYRNSITAVNLPDGLTTIGLGAFEYCKKLTSITIPETVNLIGKWAFYNCTNLTSLNIPESVHAFGLYAFVGIAVPQPLMNSHFFCFMPREYSGKYTIPEGITNIISFAFERCVQLTEVIIPSSAKDLGYSAFGSCTALQSITSLAVNPPACREEMSFKDVDKSIPVYVPAESIDAYKAAGEWKEFENIQPIQAEEVPVTEIEAEPTYNSVVIEWPKVDEATVYTIEIRKDGELVCTLTFNEQGQLQGITFAKPSRNGGRNSQVRMAIQTATGWQYTISGLDPDTEYTYSVVAKKNAGDTETLFSDSVTFTTKQTPTGVDDVSNQPSEVGKLLRNGQLLIIRNGEIFNAQGARVE